MASITNTIDVKVPVAVAYNQFTQFEEFPLFMNGVVEVKQLDDKRLHWKAEIAGKTEEWDAEITHQTADTRIAWQATSGAKNAGLVTFDKVDEATTRVTLQLEYEPKGLVENIGSALGVVSARVSGDLERFKSFIEARGEETGAWRGEIEGNRVETSPEI